ncbi:unnamed protein product [Spirodela intermedia]|uniref:Uncharacterized protein n=2 Tax=Spirodela intermedia TaxID=51605 RepID=A0A7I8L8S9_SPIIN|nr:unnamed protein product [Spirodela intermedia]CAA6669507.1 unnamed protein product [Spirodela intermedia]CAA7406467.1 unnamed protein product [Spirodela intermedia]
MNEKKNSSLIFHLSLSFFFLSLSFFSLFSS